MYYPSNKQALQNLQDAIATLNSEYAILTDANTASMNRANAAMTRANQGVTNAASANQLAVDNNTALLAKIDVNTTNILALSASSVSQKTSIDNLLAIVSAINSSITSINSNLSTTNANLAVTNTNVTNLTAIVEALKKILNESTRVGQAAIPVIAIGGFQNITITWDRPFVLPTGKTVSDIKIMPIVAGLSVSLMDKTTFTEVSRSLSNVVLKVSNNNLVALSLGSSLVCIGVLPTA